MTDITRADMVLHRTERTTGGRMGASEITGGATDYLFKPLTTLGRATGEIEIKGLYAYLKNAGTGQLLKGFMFVARPPTDEHVSVALMSRRVWGDTMSDWIGYLTNYLQPSAPLSWWAFQTTAAGSEVITLWGKPTAELPQVGKTYILRGNPGQQNQYEQAVVVTDITTRVEEFYDEVVKTYYRTLATVFLDRPLRYAFTGPDVQPWVPKNPPFQICETNPSSGVRIYGISRLTAPVSVGDQRLSIDSPSTQIIPSALDETYMADQTAAGVDVSLVPAADGVVTFTFNDDLEPGASIYLGSPSLPGSVQIVAGLITLTETAGQLKSGETVVALVNSATGVVSAIADAPTYTGPLTIRFRPAAPVSAPRLSAEIQITEANQGRKFVMALNPPPARGTLMLSYLVGDTWYKLYDQGDGTLKGTSDLYGQAQLTTGNSLAMTLGYPPDIGTSIIVQWGTAAYTFDRSGTNAGRAGFLITTSQGFSAGDTVTWNDGIASRTATIGSDGNLTGDATGQAWTGAKQILLKPAILPPPGTVATVHITPRATATETFTGAIASSGDPIPLAHDGIVAGSVRVQIDGAVLDTPGIVGTNITGGGLWRDNGSGSVTGLGASLDYTAGEITLPVSFTRAAPAPIYDWVPQGMFLYWMFVGWSATYSGTGTYAITGSSNVTVSYQYGSAGSGVTETHTLTSALVDILPDSVEAMVGGSLRATFAGHTLTDSAGALYADRSPATGTGTWVGSADYSARRLTLQSWTGGQANAFTVQALTTRYGRDAVTNAVFRTPSAPVKPTSLSVRAVQLDGTVVSATADGTGNLTADGILGKITVDTGITRVRFGRMVTAAGHESAPWYRAQDVVAGQIFEPLPVFADSILFDCVTLTRAVLADDVIGIDTARIPGGRVDHIRKGDVLLIHDTKTVTVSSPTANAAVNCGRTYLERAWVHDANGAEVPGVLSDTEAELNAGVLHWVSNLSTSGHPTPWTVYHRISDLGTVNAVDRFGNLAIRGVGGQSGTAHAYEEGAFVSSLLYLGDMGVADSPVPWAQALWGGVWSDSLIGNPADRAYDYLTYPIELTNQGSTLNAGVALVFESDGLHFRCYIQGIGIIDTGVSITADYAPINPVTGVPYFTIRGNNGGEEPWGAAAWPYLSCLRFQLQPSTYPAQAIRCVQPSAPSGGTDSALIEFAGGL